MITLIIFLCLIFIFFLFTANLKMPITFNLKIANEDINFYYKMFFKERHIKNKVTDFIKSGSAEFDKEVLLDVSEVIDIEEFKTNVIIGTPFIHVTNVGVLFLSYVIPTLYRLPFRKKEGLYFKVIPEYYKWNFKVDVVGNIRVSLISALVIFYKVKRRIKSKNIRVTNA